MPSRRAGIKELRKNHTNRMRNLDQKTEIKKQSKSFLASVETKNVEEAKSGLSLIFKKLDKAAKTNLMKKNTVSRRKSRFSKLLATLTS
ncbi:MAG: small subunit ribosomal protein S20 [Lysobacterales bacterium]|jgi:small subunit ribosomal protein S20